MLRAVMPVILAGVLLAAGLPRPAGVGAPFVLDPDEAIVAAADLRDGDVAMIAGGTAVSRLVLSISGPEARYSHCGVIVRDRGRWAIVHAAPLNDGTGDTGLTAALGLDEFARRESVRLLEIFRHHDPAAASRAARVARSYADAAVPFDGAFDLQSDERIYCSELVWKAYLHAGSPCLLNGRFDRGASAFAPEVMILPSSLASSDQLRRVGVLVIDSPVRAMAQTHTERSRR